MSRPALPHRRCLAMAAVLAASLSLGGCELPDFVSFDPQTRGNMVDADTLKELVPGTTTRADVTSLIGTPTAKATFDDNTWIYISEVTRPIIGGTLGVDDQRVVVLSFDQAGVLRNIQTKSQKDSQPVQVVSRTTPSPGSSASILQQLLGNVGKFSPVAPTGSGGADIGGSGATLGK